MTATAQRSRQEFAGPAEYTVFRRRLAILVLLHALPRTADQLLNALERAGLISPDDRSQPLRADPRLYAQFRHDLAALNEMDHEIKFDRHTNLYYWYNSPFGLSLAEGELNGLAILFSSLANEPSHADLASVLNYLRDHLPSEQRAKLPTPTFSIQVQQSSEYLDADPHNKLQIELAIRRWQQLELDYVSPNEGRQVHHVVEPRPLNLHDGHVYLPIWDVAISKEYELRLSRIVAGSAHLLRTIFQHERIDRSTHLLRYRLSPLIARNDVTIHFPNQQTAPDPDLPGWTLVTATVKEKDYFAAKKLLLGYGSHVEVLSPPALVAEFAELAAILHQRYCSREL